MAKKQDEKPTKVDLQKDIKDKHTPKKSLNRKAFVYIQKYLSETSAKYFKECNNFMSFLTNADMSAKKSYKASDCKNRFCPVCSWKKSRKDAIKISIMLKAIEVEEKKDFLFLTLTAPNCTAEELPEEIDRFNKAYHKMFKRRNVQRGIKGYIRKLEVTTDQEEFITKELYRLKKDYYDKRNLKVGDKNPTYNTYHPHFHAILIANKSYFTKNYIKHEEWLQMWRECMEDETINQVRIEKLKDKGNTNGVLEVAKYAAKSDDLLTSEKVFDVFYRALKGRQILTFQGLAKEYAKKYENGELDEYKEKDENVYTHILTSLWSSSKYVNSLRELTKAELIELNKNNFIEESED